MMEAMAIEYFRSLSAGERKRILKRIVAALAPEERIELAKLLLKK